uniref:ATP synthase F0 subunit 8 n=1 Tax=Tricentrus fulgidus TaxID=3021818 RepID=UPI00237BC57E|nr:ATP synthase F0 subunit 8 [Tricentrus fulgidus]WBV77305.1 ATP synthase F0 subunit 8 [Tricentrus fulgidus]
MPQMAPMWWMTMMITFNSMVMMMISIMYFNYKTKILMKTENKKKNLNWKWY